MDKKPIHKFLNDEHIITEISPDEEFPEILQKSADSIAKREGYINHNVEKKTVSTNGGNYLGVLYNIDIKGVTSKGPNETYIFVKRIQNRSNNLFFVDEAYRREAVAYNELFKIYNELQDKAKIPNEERFKTVKSYEETNSEAIFLENLTKKGYKTGCRMEVMSYKFAELSVIQLARFHGLSMVLQKKRPEYFEKILKPLNQLTNFNEDWNKLIINLCETTRKYLGYKLKRKTEHLANLLIEKLPKYFMDDSSNGTYCCICHGDYRQNNVLMKDDEGEVTEVIPIDYQLMFIGCPIIDLLYFIFNASDRDFRRKHLESLKELYYESLDKFLKFFDLDVNTVFPKHDFDREYKAKFEFGLMIAVYTTPFCFVLEEEVPDVCNDDLATVNFKLDDRFKDRIRGVLDDYVEWGYL